MDERVREYETVVYRKKGPVAEIVLNRPAVLNAMNDQMHRDLGAIWDDFEADGSVQVGVISGSGSRAFSVGRDLKEAAQSKTVTTLGSAGQAGSPRLTERFDLVKPLVAKIAGYAWGGGFELALACDIIVAASHATFALPEVRRGLVAGAGGLVRLPRQVPPRIAAGYALTGRTMSATAAAQFGLVNEVVSAEHLDRAVQAWVEDLLNASPVAVRAAKEILWKSQNLPLHEAFRADYQQETLRRLSSDALEGTQAFAERRDPRWAEPPSAT